MTTVQTKTGYVVKHRDDVPPTACPCGASVRIITAQDTPAAGFHITHIRDSQKHYHKKTTEIYYILEGWGRLEIGNEVIELRPGLCILIRPGTPHRGAGDFQTIVVPAPAFDPDDEYVVEQQGTQ